MPRQKGSSILKMNLLERVIGVVTPFNCLGCGREGDLICEQCAPRVCPPLPSRCYSCRSATEGFAVCERCRRASSLKRVWVRTELSGLARDVLHAYKFERAQAAAPLLAGYMSGILPKLTSDTVIIPVPTATSRFRQRGYDHAKLLARELAGLTGLVMSPALSRLNQSRQVGTKRGERLNQLMNAFWVNRQSLLAGARILLIDDVVTTGATLEEAARILKRAGARTVDAAVFAQK